MVISVEELGFKKGGKLKHIFAKAKERGLELCPNEVGPVLRLDYKDQPNGEWLVIGMEPITASDGDLRLFGVVHNVYGQWLSGHYGYLDVIWSGYNRFVFVLPRK